MKEDEYVTEFAIFCIENTAIALSEDPKEVYLKLRDSGILDNYIIGCYDILHTQGKEYIVENIIEEMKERGIA